LPFIEYAAQKPALFQGGKEMFSPPMTPNDTQGLFKNPAQIFFESLSSRFCLNSRSEPWYSFFVIVGRADHPAEGNI
jgi:hypothetical protein